MPVWSVRFQHTALLYLLAGFGTGAVLLASRGLGMALPWGVWLAVHVEFLLIGWMLQFTMGVAHWMLPKHASGPERGGERPVRAAWFLLNTGVWLAVLGQVLAGQAALVAAGRLMEFGAVLAFAVNAWPRIKPFGVGR